VNPESIREKFGGDYVATERTFKMGIHHRLAACMAARFTGRHVLETCSGAGFTTIALARVAAHVVTVEIDPEHRRQARDNLERAGLLDRVTMIAGDILSESVLAALHHVEAAFLDPDWADAAEDHVHRFRDSTMQPPADRLLTCALERIAADVALVLPPGILPGEFEGLPAHECQRLYLADNHALDCLYFGRLRRSIGVTITRL
jgi:SAM-dependent methyltransferase